MQQKDKIGIYALGLLILLGMGFFFAHKAVTQNNPEVASTASTASHIETQTIPPATTGILPGLQTGPLPWTANIDNLRDRLADIGLPALAQEGTVLHIHQHLDISINGASVTIPAGIGINEDAGFISPIHVHDTTGIIHVESPTVQTFTLGQFFDIWGVRLSPVCIGGYCASESMSLRVYVNGKLYQGNPRDIELAAHQEIYIYYGASKDIPQTIPSTYQFPAGY
jgi:hypothetical protein